MWMTRLKSDFELANVTLFGGCAVLGIAPFALYRFASGQTMIGVVDSLIVTAIAVAVAHAWRSGDARRAGLFMALFNTLGCIAITLLFGRHGLPWVYVVAVTSYFLTTRHVAAVANIVMIATLAIDAHIYFSKLELISFVVTASLVSIYAFLFAHRTQTQREQLQVLATHDPLTGTGNRRLMEIELAQVAGREAQLPMTLAVFDIDHFKRVNDDCGHEAGDRVLTDFARLVLQGARSGDRWFRYGGEEFVLLMRATDLTAAAALLRQLQDTLRASLRSPLGAVSVSIGCALLLAGEDWTRWLARADSAMYLAKRSGRDCLIAADAA